MQAARQVLRTNGWRNWDSVPSFCSSKKRACGLRKRSWPGKHCLVTFRKSWGNFFLKCFANFFVRCFEWQCARLKLSATWVTTFYQAATLRLRIAYNASRGQGRANGLVQLHLGKRKGLLMWFLFCLPVFSFVGMFLCLVLWGCARLLRCVREATKTRCAWLVNHNFAGEEGQQLFPRNGPYFQVSFPVEHTSYGHLVPQPLFVAVCGCFAGQGK